MHSPAPNRELTDATAIGCGLLSAAMIGITCAFVTGDDRAIGVGMIAAGLIRAGLLLLALIAALLWSVRPPAVGPTAACILTMIIVAAVTGALIGSSATAFGAAITALAVAMGVAVCAGVAGVIRERRRTRRLGWELARALADRETASVEQAVTRERSVMAGEIHDRLGHQLTLMTLQLSRLSLDPGLDQASRDSIDKIRTQASDIAADLGETVRLLKTGGEPDPVDRQLSAVLEGAQNSGLRIDSRLPAELDGDLGVHTRAALERMLTETLTNAAKHAPGQFVRVSGEIADGRAVVRVRNRLAVDRSAPEDTRHRGPGSRHGLTSVGHRIQLLEGQFTAGVRDEEFVVRASVPLHARPVPPAAHRSGIDREQDAAHRRSRRRLRLAVTAPVALATAAVIITVLSMTYFTVASVLPPERYAQISVRMPRAEAERLLPPIEMLDAPRTVLPHPTGAECRFYEASSSLFVRDDVYRICFADGIVSARDVIPA